MVFCDAAADDAGTGTTTSANNPPFIYQFQGSKESVTYIALHIQLSALGGIESSPRLANLNTRRCNRRYGRTKTPTGRAQLAQMSATSSFLERRSILLAGSDHDADIPSAGPIASPLLTTHTEPAAPGFPPEVTPVHDISGFTSYPFPWHRQFPVDEFGVERHRCRLSGSISSVCVQHTLCK